MRLAAVVFTPAAERDLDDIWWEIAQHNLLAADRTIDRIRERTEQLARFPNSGHLRPEIAASARFLTEGNYLILYTVKQRQVDIIRIVHGARDLTSLL
jgi:toxin ParE1/3/4